MGISLISAARYLPKGSLTNFDLEKMVETSDEWIQQRTGLISRTIAEDETVADMAIKAGVKCLENVTPEIKNKIKVLILTTVSYLQVVPHVAAKIVEPLGLNKDILAYDLNAGCTSFIYALNTIERFLIKPGDYALIVSSDKLSDYTDYTDRGTCILLGDGAAATLWEYSQETDYFSISQTITNPEVLCREGKYVQMNGAEIFKFAVSTLPGLIEEICTKGNVAIEDVDLFLLHQANARIIESVARKLKTDDEKFPVRYQNIGNTSSPSIPILMTQLIDENKLQNAKNIVLAGFGAGLSLGIVLLKGNGQYVVK
ncbi:MAG: beta-ketoacyl-ACP synthase 3 [Clostridiaceae bacterium]|nr:beta-ketoacyl-ACP synthase 3 [Clostridiaceae bacterium]